MKSPNSLSAYKNQTQSLKVGNINVYENKSSTNLKF